MPAIPIHYFMVFIFFLVLLALQLEKSFISRFFFLVKEKYRQRVEGKFFPYVGIEEENRLRTVRNRVRSGIRYHYEDRPDVDRNYSIDSLGITGLLIEDTPEKIVVTITTGRPGIVIGAGGKDIDALAAFLTDEMEKKVCIEIEEYRLWGWETETLPTGVVATDNNSRTAFV